MSTIKQYRKQIADLQMGEIKKASAKQKALEEGNFYGRQRMYKEKPVKSVYDTEDLIREQPSMYGDYFSDFDYMKELYDRAPEPVQKPKKRIMKKKAAIDYQQPMEEHEQLAKDLFGGKFHFVKSLEKAGKSAKKDLSNTASTIKNVGLKTVGTLAGKEIGTYAYNGLKDMGKSLMQAAPEIETGLVESAPALEEAAPLMLMAAGIRKPRKKSEKEMRRHELIRLLMKKHGMTLAQASKTIKERNMEY